MQCNPSLHHNICHSSHTIPWKPSTKHGTVVQNTALKMDVVFRLCGQWWYKMAEKTGSSNDLYHCDMVHWGVGGPNALISLLFSVQCTV